MRQPEPFLPEEVKNLLRSAIDLTMNADLSKIPVSPFAQQAEEQLRADLRSREPPTSAQVQERRARILVANLLAHVVGGGRVPELEESGTAAKLLNLFSARLR